MNRVRAIVQKDRPLYTKNYSMRRRQREARIRVLLAGICSTDLEIIQGYMGFKDILGHEFFGVVEASPDPA